jgi:hypothetical protein
MPGQGDFRTRGWVAALPLSLHGDRERERGGVGWEKEGASSRYFPTVRSRVSPLGTKTSDTETHGSLPLFAGPASNPVPLVIDYSEKQEVAKVITHPTVEVKSGGEAGTAWPKSTNQIDLPLQRPPMSG